MERTAGLLLVGTYVLAGSLHLWSWAQQGDRLPRYIHGLAFGAALLGIVLGSIDYREHPSLGFVWLVVLAPLLVYVTFGVFGEHVMNERGGRSVVAHGVERRGDSIRAIPRWRPPTCDSCALWFPLTGIDSVRTRRYSAGRTFGLMGGAAVALMIYGLTQIPPGVP